MPKITIETGDLRRPTVTVNTDECSLFIHGEYRGWPEEPYKKTMSRQMSRQRREFLRFPSLAKTDKGRMIEAFSFFVPENLRYPVFLFPKENGEELKMKIREAIKEKKWVGIVTCYSDGQKYAGKGHYVMGMDNEEIFNFFFGEFFSEEEKQQAYKNLRRKYPHFHQSDSSTYQDWLKEEKLKEVAVFIKPPCHAYRQENHFVCGAYLRNGELVIEIYPFTYHTRSQDRRGQRSIISVKIPPWGTLSEKDLLITEEKAQETRKALAEFYSREDLGSLVLNAPDKKTLEKLVTTENLALLIRNITQFFLGHREELIGALKQLETYGYFCLDFIGKIGEDNSVEYCRAFEAKGINF